MSERRMIHFAIGAALVCGGIWIASLLPTPKADFIRDHQGILTGLSLLWFWGGGAWEALLGREEDLKPAPTTGEQHDRS